MVLTETSALVGSLWAVKGSVILVVAVVYLAFWLRRAVRDGYFDAVPTLNVYVGKGAYCAIREVFRRVLVVGGLFEGCW